MRLLTLLLMVLICGFTLRLSAQIKSTGYSSTNYSNYLAEDGNNIWIATTGGIIIRDKNGVMKSIITEQNGLPSNNVSKIKTDPFGNKWAAFTYKGGLAKFNGSTWTYYESALGIKLYYVNDFAFDLEGNLWVLTLSAMGSYRLLLKYDGISWSLYYVPTANINIRSLAIDAFGNKWIGVSGDGLFKFRDGKWTHYTTADGLLDNTVREVFVDRSNNVWMATSSGASRFDGSVFSSYTAGGLNMGIHTVTQDVNNDYWFSTSTLGVVQYNGSTYKSHKTLPEGIVNNTILYVLVDLQNNKWVVSATGIGKYDNSVWKNYTISSLDNNWVSDVAVDNQGKIICNGESRFDGVSWNNLGQGAGITAVSPNDNIWLGTSAMGVIRWTGSMWTFYTMASGLLSNSIRCITAKKSNGHVWAGTILGVSVYNGANWSTSYSESNGLNGKEVLAIEFDKSGTAWIGTDSGLNAYNGSTWKYYNTFNGALPNNTVQAVTVDTKGNIWAGTWGGGLCKYDGATWTYFTNANTGININNVRALAADSIGNVWICCFGGLAKCDGKNITLYTSDKNGLPAYNEFRDIVVDQNNVKWLGTVYGGLVKITCDNPVGKFSFNTACLPNDSTKFINKSEKVDATTKYEWDIMDDGSVESTKSDFSYLFPSESSYPVSFYVYNDECLVQAYDEAVVGKKPGLALSVKSDTAICLGSNLPLISKLTNTNPSASYTYQWSTGSADTQIVVSDKGSYFVSVEESGSGCTSTSDTIKVDVTEPYDSSAICMVTVNAEKNKNMIIWERKNNKNIAFYNIYKVYGTIYSPVGSQPFDSLSVFTDFTSMPDATPERYAISISDKCKNESAKSLYHQTLLLQTSKSLEPNKANLLWKNYVDESDVMQPDSFIIYKGKNKTSMARIYARPYDKSDIQLFTDVNFDGISAYYQVALHFKDICSPAILKAEAGPYTQSLSNIAEYKTEKAGLEENSLSATAYPNPFIDNITLSFSQEKQENVLVEVIDALGSKAIVSEFAGQPSGMNLINLPLPQLAAGVYTIKIIAGENIQTLMCVKQ